MRIFSWYLAVASMMFSGLGFFLYYELKEIVFDSMDNHLHSEVQLLAGMIVEEGHMKPELFEMRTGDYAVPLSGHYFQILSSSGEIIGRSHSLTAVNAYLPVERVPSDPYYHTITGPGKSPLRLLTESFATPVGTITIQASESLEDSYRLLRSFSSVILLVLPLCFLILGGGFLVITRWSLEPLGRFSKKINRITARNLNTRVEERGVVNELQPLAQNFNIMLDHLEKSFLNQRRFLSDASHDLRTPVSVIKSYCDVTLDRQRSPAEYEESVKKISETIAKVADIIDRILKVSQLESEPLSLTMGVVNTKIIMEDVVKLLEPYALSSYESNRRLDFPITPL